MKHKVIIDAIGDIQIQGIEYSIQTVNQAADYHAMKIPTQETLIVSDKPLKKGKSLFTVHVTEDFIRYTNDPDRGWISFCTPVLMEVFKKIPKTIYWKLA